MKTAKLLLALALLVGCSLMPVHSVSALPAGLVPIQDAPPISAIKSADGYVLVWNGPDLHFTLAIKGKDIKPLPDSERVFFQVDGMVFQVQLAQISQFAPNAKETKLDNKAILAAHRDWETKYLEDTLGFKLKVQSSNASLESGGDALLWQYDMPEAMKVEAKKQVYLTVVSGDYVLVLNSVVTATVSEAQARKLLQDALATLKTSAVEIDVKKLAESIRNGVAP
jgi:hypothetical protein